MTKSPSAQSAIRDPKSEMARPVPRLLDGILVFFLALAVALRPLLPGHRDEANLWVEMCVFIAALAWLTRAAMQRRLRLERTGMGLPLAALLLLAAVSAARSPHPAESLATLLEWLAYGSAFAVLVATVARERGPGRGDFLRLLWASAFVVVLYGLFQQYVNFPLLQRMIAADPSRVTAELRMSREHIGDLMARATGRIFSTFLLSNSFAGFLALVVPGFLGHVLDRVRAGERGRWFLGTSVLWLAAALACLLLTFSKGGWVAFAVGMAAFAAILGKGLLVRHARLLLGIVGAALAGIVLLVAVGVVPTQLLRDAVTSGDVRLGYWQGALGMARDQPLAGVGLGTFGVHYPLYRPLLAHPVQDTHNDYLQMLAELGVPGLAAFLWLWAAWLRSAFRKAGAPAEQEPRKPSRSPRRLPALLPYAVAVVAFFITTTAMDTFEVAGWWDQDAASLEQKAWLDRALLVGFLACWWGCFAVLGRGAAREPGELCRKGLVCGVIAFLAHCALDFDYQEPGVAFTAWVVAALSVRPRRAAAERRLGVVPAVALAAGALVAVAAFQFVLWQATRAATERDLAATALRDAADPRRAPTPQRRDELLLQACRHYEEALRANPLDDSLRMDYASLLVSRLMPPVPGPRPDEESPDSPRIRVRIETADHVRLFGRAVELYRRAAELNRPWAAPRLGLGRLCMAAAAPNAGRRAVEALRPLVAACLAQRGALGPNTLYLPAAVEFDEALVRDPNNPKVMLPAAEALKALGDLDAARALAERAMSIGLRIARAQPGHKLCLAAGEAARLQRVIGPNKEHAPQ